MIAIDNDKWIIIRQSFISSGISFPFGHIPWRLGWQLGIHVECLEARFIIFGVVDGLAISVARTPERHIGIRQTFVGYGRQPLNTQL